MADKVSPITPSEAAREKGKAIPAAVIEVFNQLIALNYINGSAVFSQNDVVLLLVVRGFSRQQIFNEGWLNIEEIYQSAGWQVTYNRPAFDETYSTTFKFKRS